MGMDSKIGTPFSLINFNDRDSHGGLSPQRMGTRLVSIAALQTCEMFVRKGHYFFGICFDRQNK
jgi:hypothetical protein